MPRQRLLDAIQNGVTQAAFAGEAGTNYQSRANRMRIVYSAAVILKNNRLITEVPKGWRA